MPEDNSGISGTTVLQERSPSSSEPLAQSGGEVHLPDLSSYDFADSDSRQIQLSDEQLSPALQASMEDLLARLEAFASRPLSSAAEVGQEEDEESTREADISDPSDEVSDQFSPHLPPFDPSLPLVSRPASLTPRLADLGVLDEGDQRSEAEARSTEEQEVLYVGDMCRELALAASEVGQKGEQESTFDYIQRKKAVALQEAGPDQYEQVADVMLDEVVRRMGYASFENLVAGLGSGYTPGKVFSNELNSNRYKKDADYRSLVTSLLKNLPKGTVDAWREVFRRAMVDPLIFGYDYEIPWQKNSLVFSVEVSDVLNLVFAKFHHNIPFWGQVQRLRDPSKNAYDLSQWYKAFLNSPPVFKSNGEVSTQPFIQIQQGREVTGGFGPIQQYGPHILYADGGRDSALVPRWKHMMTHVTGASPIRVGLTGEGGVVYRMSEELGIVPGPVYTIEQAQAQVRAVNAGINKLGIAERMGTNFCAVIGIEDTSQASNKKTHSALISRRGKMQAYVLHGDSLRAVFGNAQILQDLREGRISEEQAAEAMGICGRVATDGDVWEAMIHKASERFEEVQNDPNAIRELVEYMVRHSIMHDDAVNRLITNAMSEGYFNNLIASLSYFQDAVRLQGHPLPKIGHASILLKALLRDDEQIARLPKYIETQRKGSRARSERVDVQDGDVIFTMSSDIPQAVVSQAVAQSRHANEMVSIHSVLRTLRGYARQTALGNPGVMAMEID